MNLAFLAREADPARAYKKLFAKKAGNGLRISQPGDSVEKEADRVADTVSSGSRVPAWSLATVNSGSISRQPAPTSGQPSAVTANNYGDALLKVAEAVLKTKTGQDMVKYFTEDDPLVKATGDFVKTPTGIAVAGATAAGAIATLAATHKPLPAQLPAIPLDKLSSRLTGFSLKLTYEGPVDRPTSGMLTLSYKGKSPEKKKPNNSEAYRVETAQLAADQARFRAGLQPSGPATEQRKKENQWIQDTSLRRGTITGGILESPAWDPAQVGKKYPHFDLHMREPAIEATPTKPAEVSTSPTAAVPEQGKKEEIPVHRKASSAIETLTDADTAQVESVLRTGGRPLDRETRRYMESHIGFDFASVRIHTDQEAATSADAVGALAYTVGSDVVFAAGRYAPSSAQGRRLLAHELTHVVQQTPAPKAVARNPVPAPSRTSRLVQRWWNPLADLKTKLMDRLKKLPGYDLFSVILGKDLITGQQVDRSPSNVAHGVLELVPGGEDAFNRMKESGAIERAWNWLSSEIDKLGFSEQYFLDLLQKAKDAVDVAHLEDSWERVKGIFREPYERLKTFAGNVLHKILEFVLEAILEGIGGKEIAAQIMDFFRKAGKAIQTIAKDPGAFLGHLLDSLKQGFSQFKDNILEHLKSGLVQWLFGEIAATGLTMPKKFDLSGIIGLVLQILGITYARLKKKLVDALGDPAVQFLEGSFEVLKTIYTNGIGAAWKLILEKAENLFDTVMESVRNWVVTKIVTMAVAHLATMFNPVGGAVEAIRVIYETVKFFIDKAKQVASLLSAIVDSISEIAAGNIAKAANWIEQSMAKAIPLMLRFLAGLIGLGNIGDKIREIIKNIQAKVDGAVQKVLDFIIEKGKALWAAGKETFHYVMDWWKEKRPFKLGEEEHEMFIEGNEEPPKILVASSAPTTLQIFLDNVSASKEEKRELLALAKKIKLRRKKVTEKDDSNKDGDENFELLLKKIAQLKSGGVKKPPKSSTKHAGTHTLGGGVKADALLSLDHPVGSAPEQTAPAIWDDLGQSLRDKKRYVRGHLLSQRLGGEGVWKNMMPITNSANQTMFNRVEKQLIAAVGTGKCLIHYTVTATYSGKRNPASPEEAENRLQKLAWDWKPAVDDNGTMKDAEEKKDIDACINAMPEKPAADTEVDPKQESVS